MWTDKWRQLDWTKSKSHVTMTQVACTTLTSLLEEIGIQSNVPPMTRTVHCLHHTEFALLRVPP